MQGRAAVEVCCVNAGAVLDQRADDVLTAAIGCRGKRGHNEAMFYMPDKEIAVGAVLLSHSAIHADTSASVDLLPFALTLAHALLQRSLPLDAAVQGDSDSHDIGD